jgi:hypothetical protein
MGRISSSSLATSSWRAASRSPTQGSPTRRTER